MTLSRQENSRKTGDRSNQRARTRAAIVAAAMELVNEGRSASVPDAAERALVSVATAYRYFPSAEELWSEASFAAVEFLIGGQETEAAIEGAGSDVAARVDALVKTLGWMMVDDQLPFRRMAKASNERWFEHRSLSAEDRVPVREGRRFRFIRLALQPLQTTWPEDRFEELVVSLGVGIGSEAMISLVDVGNLDADEAKAAMLRTCRWILAGAMAANASSSTANKHNRSRS